MYIQGIIGNRVFTKFEFFPRINKSNQYFNLHTELPDLAKIHWITKNGKTTLFERVKNEKKVA